MDDATPSVEFNPEPPKKRWLLWAGIITGVAIIAVVAVLLFRQAGSPDKTNTAKDGKATTPITITLKGISAGQTLTKTVEIVPVLSDPSRVIRVEYSVDGVFVGVTYATPYNFTLEISKLKNGEHTIVAKAYDKGGKGYVSKGVTIIVQNENAVAAVPAPPLASSGDTTAKPSGGASGSSGGSGGTAPSPDTTSPSVPANVMLAADDGYTTVISWNASTDNVGVNNYQVYRNGQVLGTSTGTEYRDQTVVPGNTYSYAVTAQDAANNTSAPSNQPSITLIATSIWIAGDTPQNTIDDTGSYELGVKFKPLVSGKITGIKFYKRSGDNATHTGNLWTAGGSNMGTFTFSGESVSGWQTGTFATPIDVAAGTTYVASYFTPDAMYGYTGSYFSLANGGITSQYLSAFGSGGADGSNGVFRTSAGFPSSSSGDANYWVDVLFVPNPSAGGPPVTTLDNSKTYSGFPGTNNTGVTIGRRLPLRDRGVDVHQPNTIVENIELTKSNAVNIFANNVTVRNVLIAPTDGNVGTWGIRQNSGVSGLVVQDTTIKGNGTTQMQYGILDAGSNMSVSKVNISCYSNGIQSNVSVTVEDSIIHSPCYYAGDHTDAFISTGGSNITLTHNTFHNTLNQTAAIGLFCDFSAITDATVSNNLLIGAGYSLYAGSTGTGNCAGSQNNKFLNNKFSREVWPNGGFNGPVSQYTALPGNQFSGNTWLDDGTTVSP